MKPLILTIILYISLSPGLLGAEEVVVPADDYPPWKIVQNGEFIEGIDSYLIATLLEDLDLTPRYKLCPWKRCLAMMKNGKGDLISGVTLTKERQEYLVYLVPPYKKNSQQVLYVRREMSSAFTTLKDMEQKNIGLLRGARYFSAFHENQAIFKKEINTDLQGMKMVVAGRLDGFLITKENGEYLLKENPQLKQDLEIAIWRYNNNVEVYFAISKKSNLITRINELETRLKYLIESGIVEKIIREFLR